MFQPPVWVSCYTMTDTLIKCNELPVEFSKLVSSSTLQTKKAMLDYLQKDIFSLSLKTSPKDYSRFVDFVPDFISNNTDGSAKLFTDLLEELESFDLVSSVSNQVKTQWLNSTSATYTFGGKKHLPKAIDNYPAILYVLDMVNNFPSTVGKLDSCLVTCYSTSQRKLSLHSDNEPEIDQECSICTVSLGATRTIKFVPKRGNYMQLPCTTHELEHGSMFSMAPGCQSVLKHEVIKTTAVRGESRFVPNKPNIRYSLSFRRLNPNENVATSVAVSHITNMKPKDTDITTGEKENQSDSVGDKATPTNTTGSTNIQKVKIVAPVEKVTLIAGDSFTAKFNTDLLGKGRKKVINISEGGYKIRNVLDSLNKKSLELDPLSVDQVFLSVGANDIRNCKVNGVRHLYGPFLNLIKCTKKLFPMAKIHVQSLLPLPVTNCYVINNVLDINLMLDRICRMERVYILDVFWKFLDDFNEYRSLNYFPMDHNDVHPNTRGLGYLAHHYISRIHCRKFDPYSPN